MLAQVGDFSVSNYGDGLYPGVFRALLRHLGFEGHVRYFAPLPGEAAGEFVVEPYRRVSRAGVDAVIVGGGDLIRTDRITVAHDHLCVETGKRRRLAARARAELFARRVFVAGPGPWLPIRGWAARRPTALMSVGVHDLPTTGSVADALAHVTRAWVRTEQASPRLERAGLDPASIVVAPDAVFALRHAVDVEAIARDGSRLLREAVGGRLPVVLLQAAPFAGWDVATIVRCIRDIRGAAVALLPLGRYAGEERILQRAASAGGASYLGLRSVAEITAMIAAADAMITTSMHAAIVRAVCGMPVVIPNISKTAEALHVCPVPPRVVQAEPADAGAAAVEVIGEDVGMSSERNAQAVTAAFASSVRPLLG